jgi:two-component system, OmpR family, response regulator
MSAAPTILCVDDQALQRELLSSVLRHAGYTVHACSTEAEALAAVETLKPAAIVSDVLLEDAAHGGIDLAQRLQKSHPTIPVVFRTGTDDFDKQITKLQLTNARFVPKVDLHGLRTTLAEVAPLPSHETGFHAQAAVVRDDTSRQP